MAWFPDTTEVERAPEIAPPIAPTLPFPEWSEEEVAQLRALRAEGLTCVQVAERMGKTKGMIVGKLYRLANKSAPAIIDESALEELAIALVEAVPAIEEAPERVPEIPRRRSRLPEYPHIGMRVCVNETFPYGSHGREGVIMEVAQGGKARWIGVRFDDDGDCGRGSKYLARWHRNYFDLVSETVPL